MNYNKSIQEAFSVFTDQRYQTMCSFVDLMHKNYEHACENIYQQSAQLYKNTITKLSDEICQQVSAISETSCKNGNFSKELQASIKNTEKICLDCLRVDEKTAYDMLELCQKQASVMSNAHRKENWNKFMQSCHMLEKSIMSELTHYLSGMKPHTKNDSTSKVHKQKS